MALASPSNRADEASPALPPIVYAFDSLPSPFAGAAAGFDDSASPSAKNSPVVKKPRMGNRNVSWQDLEGDGNLYTVVEYNPDAGQSSGDMGPRRGCCSVM